MAHRLWKLTPDGMVLDFDIFSDSQGTSKFFFSMRNLLRQVVNPDGLKFPVHGQ